MRVLEGDEGFASQLGVFFLSFDLSLVLRFSFVSVVTFFLYKTVFSAFYKKTQPN